MLKPFKFPTSKIIFTVIGIVAIAISIIVIWGDPQIHQTTYADYDYRGYTSANDVSNWVTGYYTRGIFIVTAILSIVAVTQIWFLIRADKSQRDALVADQRAFVFASGFTAMWQVDPGGDPMKSVVRFHPIWRNSGRSQTRRLRIITNGEVRDAKEPIPMDVEPTVDFSKAGTGLLGPQTEKFGGAFPLAGMDIGTVKDILDGKVLFYIWGECRYFDIFDAEREHRTKFCWVITVGGNPLIINPATNLPDVRWGNLTHGRGNCADEECDDD